MDISIEDIFVLYCGYGEKLRPYVKDTSVELFQALKKDKSMVEGAQGISLDVNAYTHIQPHQTRPQGTYRPVQV